MSATMDQVEVMKAYSERCVDRLALKLSPAKVVSSYRKLVPCSLCLGHPSQNLWDSLSSTF